MQDTVAATGSSVKTEAEGSNPSPAAKKSNPKAIGERTEAVILARLVVAGKVVLLPFGDNQRYDFVIDENGSFKRIQCKTGRLVRGAVKFACCSSQAHRGLGQQNYRGQIEYFAVYCHEINSTYLVPVDIAGTRTCQLRILASKNNQTKGVLWAKDFVL